MASSTPLGRMPTVSPRSPALGRPFCSASFMLGPGSVPVMMRVSAMQPPPLILLSGMGADERVFAPQLQAFPQLVVPKWIEPKADESLASYAARFAAGVDPKQPCFIGGASFGGFVAMEMARHLDAIAVFLIGSVRSPAELP